MGVSLVSGWFEYLYDWTIAYHFMKAVNWLRMICLHATLSELIERWFVDLLRGNDDCATLPSNFNDHWTARIDMHII